MNPAIVECDVAIVGGGLVGSVLAFALTRLPLRVVLIESHEPGRLEQPSFDSRATALANGSQRILDSLGLWSALKRNAEPILRIHISEQGHFGVATISARDEGVDALGYTIENRVLGEAFWSALRDTRRFECMAPAELVGFRRHEDAVLANVRLAGANTEVRSQVLIAADGAQSHVRRALDIPAVEDDYQQTAVVFNCATSRSLGGLAMERFTREGPVALLPLRGDRAAVVWTVSADSAHELMNCEEAEIANRLESLLGHRLGRITRVGKRVCHRLARVRSSNLVDQRVVLIGNAAVSLHPVAGQGFNLALRDVATYAELAADELARNSHSPDIGNGELLAEYKNWRCRDQQIVAAFTHGLIRLFGLPLPGVGMLRGAGILAFDLVPGAKRLLARQTMGRAGRLPRLARGLPIG